MQKLLNQQLDFLFEIDKLKSINRQTNLIHKEERFENSAEHSWHLAIYVIILSEYSDEKIDVLKAIKMALIHDLVEIDAGDYFCYDKTKLKEKQLKERKAAKRIFNMLPEHQRNQYFELWNEFENCETKEAKFVSNLDKLQPFLHNFLSKGGTWKRYNISASEVKLFMKTMPESSQKLSLLVEKCIDESIDKGFI